MLHIAGSTTATIAAIRIAGTTTAAVVAAANAVFVCVAEVTGYQQWHTACMGACCSTPHMKSVP
eukprot:11228-Heterococcus_DN1.PRE.1